MGAYRQPSDGLTSLDDLRDALRTFDVAMLVTKEADGGMHARPMAMQDPSEMPGCDLWFVSSSATPKVREIEREEQVAVCCFRSRDPAYIALTALARIEHNRAEMHRVFQPEWRAWMPGGPEDPTGVIIKLTVLRAEYWTPEGEHETLYPERVPLEHGATSASQAEFGFD